jgi:hypothetical protein
MPDIPKGAKKPADHLPPAAQTEAEGTQFITVTWRDREFTIPASLDDASVDTIEAFEDRKGIAAVRGILGEKQWAAFKAEYKPTLRDLNSLMEPIAEAMGLDGPGE